MDEVKYVPTPACRCTDKLSFRCADILAMVSSESKKMYHGNLQGDFTPACMQPAGGVHLL